MATIGQIIPDGTFQAFHEQEIRPITLESYRGRWLVLVFYPGDFTFICPTELEELLMLAAYAHPAVLGSLELGRFIVAEEEKPRINYEAGVEL